MQLIVCLNVFAQKKQNDRALSINFNDTRLVRNVNIIYRHEVWNNWSLYGGIKYHINSQSYRGDVKPLIYVTPDEHAYFAKIEATTFGEHIGLKLGIEKSYHIPNTNTEVGGFYDFMYTHAGISSVGGGIDSNGNTFLYTPWPNINTTGSADGKLFEHHIGAIIRVQAYKQFFLSVTGAIGAYKYTNGAVFQYEAQIFSDRLTFSRMFGMGIEYKFEKKKPIRRR